MLYELLLALHITSLVGWAGLSTGGYLVARKNGQPLPTALAKTQLASAVALFATGLALAVLFYNFPKSPLWIHYALGVALVAGVLEVYHVVNTERAKDNPRRYMGGKLTPAWGAIYVVMLYLMVFKPL
ncbi:MAG: hypothetical protein ACK4SY_02480 [Pyrobaculum sp.]